MPVLREAATAMFRSLYARVLVGYLAVAWLGLLALWLASSKLFADYYIASRKAELRRIASDVAVLARPALSQGDQEEAQRVASTTARLLDARVCVFPMGKQRPVAASAEGTARAEACLVEGSYDASSGTTVTRSQTPCEPTVTLEARTPVTPLGESTAIGSVLVRTPVRGMDEVLATQRRLSLGTAALVAVLATVFGLVIAGAISRPLRTMTRAAQRLADGDFAVDLPVSAPTEAATLARTMNTMAASLRRAFADVNEERDRLSAIVSSMTEGVVAIDRSGCAVLANARASKLLGLPPGAHPTPLNVVAGEHWKEGARRQAMGEATARDAKGTEHQEQIGDRILQFRTAPLRGPEGGAVVVVEDVTDAVRIEQARREFVANASHQLRAPLTSLRGYLEALADGVADAPEARERCLGVALAQTRHMQQIVDELLELSRLEAGDITLDREPVDPCQIAAGAATAMEPQAAAKAVRVEVVSEVGATGRSPLHIDGDRILGALLNLLDNAVRHSPEGSVVTVRLTSEEGGVRIAVEDDGPGLPDGEWEQAWERFRQAPGASRARSGGAGLGLAICREIVHLHGGRVFAGPRPGSGSVFGFTLPQSPAASHQWSVRSSEGSMVSDP